MVDSLRSMHLFCRSAELGSISAAARESGLKQSQASRAIKSLEDQFGATLLLRTTRKVSLTPDGEVAILHVRDALDAVDRARDSARQESPSGLLRITAPVGYGHSVIAPIVEEFLAQAPRARADLDLTDRFVDLAASGHDIAVRIGEVHGQTLRVVSLGRCPMRIVAAPELVPIAGEIRSPQELARVPCLPYSSWREPSTWIFERADKSVAVQVQGRLSSTHLPTLRTAVLDGAGVANLPLWLVRDDLEQGRLVSLLPDWRAKDQPIQAVLPPGRHTPARTRLFLDLLQRTVREQA